MPILGWRPTQIAGFQPKIGILTSYGSWQNLWTPVTKVLPTSIVGIGLLLFTVYQGSNGCQKNWQNLRNLDLEVYCANIQLKQNILRNSTKNFWWLLEVFWSSLKIGWILAQKLNRFICEICFWIFWHPWHLCRCTTKPWLKSVQELLVWLTNFCLQ